MLLASIAVHKVGGVASQLAFAKMTGVPDHIAMDMIQEELAEMAFIGAAIYHNMLPVEHLNMALEAHMKEFMASDRMKQVTAPGRPLHGKDINKMMDVTRKVFARLVDVAVTTYTATLKASKVDVDKLPKLVWDSELVKQIEVAEISDEELSKVNQHAKDLGLALQLNDIFGVRDSKSIN